MDLIGVYKIHGHIYKRDDAMAKIIKKTYFISMTISMTRQMTRQMTVSSLQFYE